VQPCSAGDLKKNQFAMLKGHPCKIMEVRHSKTGKHGHAKCSITGVDVLTGKKYQDVQPAHASMGFAVITKTEYTLTYIDNDNRVAQLLDSNNEPYEVALEGEIAEELMKEYNPDDTDNDIVVTVMIAPEQTGDCVERKEIIIAWKRLKDQQQTPI